MTVDRDQCASSGFSLIEVLLSLSVMGLIVLVLFSSVKFVSSAILDVRLDSQSIWRVERLKGYVRTAWYENFPGHFQADSWTEISSKPKDGRFILDSLMLIKNDQCFFEIKKTEEAYDIFLDEKRFHFEGEIQLSSSDTIRLTETFPTNEDSIVYDGVSMPKDLKLIISHANQRSILNLQRPYSTYSLFEVHEAD